MRFGDVFSSLSGMVSNSAKFDADYGAAWDGILDSLYLSLPNRTGEQDLHVGNVDSAAWAAKAILVDVCGLEQQSRTKDLEHQSIK